MSVNRKRSEPTCIWCERRPQVFGLLCEVCHTELAELYRRPRSRLAPAPKSARRLVEANARRETA